MIAPNYLELHFVCLYFTLYSLTNVLQNDVKLNNLIIFVVNKIRIKYSIKKTKGKLKVELTRRLPANCVFSFELRIGDIST